MKLRVQRRDGRIETLTLVGPVGVHHGEGMDHLHSADGMDYYFLHDGVYDGWSRGADEDMTPQDAMAAIDRIERERKIEEPS